jgi:hypothetical protein
LFFFAGGGDSTDATTRVVETGVAAGGDDGGAGGAGFGGCGFAGAFGGSCFGAGSGFGFPSGFGCDGGCCFGADDGDNGCGWVAGTGCEASCSASRARVETWLAETDGTWTRCGFAAETTWTGRDGRVLTALRRADPLGGRSTKSAPRDRLSSDSASFGVAAARAADAAGDVLGTGSKEAFAAGACAGPVATAADGGDWNAGRAAR